MIFTTTMTTRKEYESSTAINHTLFRKFVISPAHFAWSRKQPKEEPSTDMKIGLAVHSQVLTPELFNEEFIIIPSDAPKKPDKRQREAKKPSPETIDAIAFWDHFNSVSAGKIALTSTEYETSRHCYFKILGSKMWKELTNGKTIITEKPFYTVWTDTDKPFEIKGIPDLYIPETKTLIDIKTVNAHPTQHEMDKAVYNRGYDTQGEFYRYGLGKIGMPVERVIFAFSEKDEPNEVGFCEQSPANREITSRFLNDKMFQLSHCLAKNEFPSLDSYIASI